MTEVGGMFQTDVGVAANSFLTVFPGPDEKIKLTMVYAKDLGGTPINDAFFIAPATGQEVNNDDGTSTGNAQIPPVGGNPSNGSSDVNGLQPILISDSQGVFLGNNGNTSFRVEILGVRVA